MNPPNPRLEPKPGHRLRGGSKTGARPAKIEGTNGGHREQVKGTFAEYLKGVKR